MPVNLYYTQRVRGFQQDGEKYTGESATFFLRRTQQRCPRCGSTDVVATHLRRRSIRGEPLGCCREVRMEFTVHRLYCPNLTIIRDLESGAVVHVGEGKGISALDGALRKLKKSKLRVVTMDMANAYYTWISEHFPKVSIVFDHFHVIKLMNDKLDYVRRRVVAKLDAVQQKQLKGLRFVFLKNNEDLHEDARLILKNMRGDFQDLGDAYMFKEALRSIYVRSKTSYHARIAFHRWCRLAEETEIPELRTMAKTIRDKLAEIVSYWTFRHISNAPMEGFNTKIRWLIRQAYGFRDREYFKLKIYQLPEISCEKEI